MKVPQIYFLGGPSRKIHHCSGTLLESFTFDDNGNLESEGTFDFTWDSKDRLIEVDDGTHLTTLRYDAFDRVIQLTTTETATSTIIEDKAFVWCGMSICQERDGSPTSTVTRELYDFGHREGTTKRFYIKDHLGSVRGMVDDSGAVTSSFDYDPYGRMTTLSGTETPSYGFAQLWHHGQTGLNLAVWRAYDPEIGRWINRDPIGMAGGINVYEYANSSPLNYIDPDGQHPLVIGAAVWGLYGAEIYAGAQVVAIVATAGLTGNLVYNWAQKGKQNWKHNDVDIKSKSNEQLQRMYEKAKGQFRKKLEKELKARKQKNWRKRHENENKVIFPFSSSSDDCP